MTHPHELHDAKATVYAFVHDNLEMPSAEEPSREELQIVLDALDELENSYVPHLPADTDTWLIDGTTDHPLPPGASVKFHYGAGRQQFLTVDATDRGLRILADHGWLSISPAAPNAVTIIGSVK